MNLKAFSLDNKTFIWIAVVVIAVVAVAALILPGTEISVLGEFAGGGSPAVLSYNKPNRVIDTNDNWGTIWTQLQNNDNNPNMNAWDKDWVVCSASYTGGTPMNVTFSSAGIDAGILEFEGKRSGSKAKMDVTCVDTQFRTHYLRELDGTDTHNWLVPNGVTKLEIPPQCLGEDNITINWKRIGGNCVRFDYMWLGKVDYDPNVWYCCGPDTSHMHRRTSIGCDGDWNLYDWKTWRSGYPEACWLTTCDSWCAGKGMDYANVDSADKTKCVCKDLRDANVTVELTECARGGDGNCLATQQITLDNTIEYAYYVEICAKRGLDGNGNNCTLLDLPPGQNNACGFEFRTFAPDNTGTLVLLGDRVFASDTNSGEACKVYAPGPVSSIKKITAEVDVCGTPNPKCAWITSMSATIRGYTKPTVDWTCRWSRAYQSQGLHNGWYWQSTNGTEIFDTTLTQAAANCAVGDTWACTPRRDFVAQSDANKCQGSRWYGGVHYGYDVYGNNKCTCTKN